MQQFVTNPWFVGGVTAAASVVLTLLVRRFATQRGFIAKPKSDRWHKRPTAMMGGVAIFAATVLAYLLFVPKTTDSAVVILASSFLFLVGLIDDVINIRPYQKLVGQLIGTALVVGFELRLPLTGYELVDIWLTVFWLVAITNAVNLLDNMDGLAAGIAMIAALSLGVGFYSNGQVTEALFVAGFIGALAGFLVFNFNPATIFMGDCGSMFVGFLLAGSVLLGQTGGRSRGIVSILAVPVLILFVPIFDTTFVTVLRKLWGRKASTGGRDHTSHRLVALGLTERNAVLVLYALAGIAGVLSLWMNRLPPVQGIALLGAFTVALALLGVYLSKVKVYEPTEEELAASDRAVFAFLVNVSHKRRIFEVFLDAFLITLSYYGAYLLLFGSFETTPNWQLFLQSLPLLVVLKLAAFLVVGVYRGIWRYTSVGDLVTFAKGVALGSLLSVIAVLLLYRFQYFSRAVFILDGIILLFAVVGSRLAFRLIREVLPIKPVVDGRRVLIYGAGDGGELVLRELRNNSALNYHPIAFVDDDPLKKDKIISGLRVYYANGTLAELCRTKEIQEILVSSGKVSKETLEAVREICRDENIELRRAQLKIEPMDFE